MKKKILTTTTERGDLCRCNNCGEYVLVPIEETQCPFCHFDGTLTYALNDNVYSIEDKEITDNFNIVRL